MIGYKKGRALKLGSNVTRTFPNCPDGLPLFTGKANKNQAYPICLPNQLRGLIDDLDLNII
jgi:hypothetical protein